MQTLSKLTSNHAQNGTLKWIGIRPKRREPLIAVEDVMINEAGLEGDHYQSGGKRTVTLIQHEHLSVIAALLGIEHVDPLLLRRNLVVSGINLLGLRNRQFKIGDCILEGTGLCAPCSRMGEYFGKGGFSAVRGHGGITAKVIGPAHIKIDDILTTI